MTFPPRPSDRAAATDVVLRAPLWTRLTVVVTGALWLVLLAITAYLAGLGGRQVWLPVLAFVVCLVVFGLACVFRPLMAPAHTRRDRLIVRRSFTSRPVRRGDIRDITLSPPSGAARIRVHTADGRSVQLPSSTRWPHGEAAHREAVLQTRALRAWAGLPF